MQEWKALYVQVGEHMNQTATILKEHNVEAELLKYNIVHAHAHIY